MAPFSKAAGGGLLTLQPAAAEPHLTDLFRSDVVQHLIRDAVEAELTRRRPLPAARRLLEVRDVLATHVQVVVCRALPGYRDDDRAFARYVLRHASQAAQ